MAITKQRVSRAKKQKKSTKRTGKAKRRNPFIELIERYPQMEVTTRGTDWLEFKGEDGSILTYRLMSQKGADSFTIKPEHINWRIVSRPHRPTHPTP